MATENYFQASGQVGSKDLIFYLAGFFLKTKSGKKNHQAEAAEGPIPLDRHLPHATEYISISASLEKISTVTSKNFLTF